MTTRTHARRILATVGALAAVALPRLGAAEEPPEEQAEEEGGPVVQSQYLAADAFLQQAGEVEAGVGAGALRSDGRTALEGELALEGGVAPWLQLEVAATHAGSARDVERGQGASGFAAGVAFGPLQHAETLALTLGVELASPKFPAEEDESAWEVGAFVAAARTVGPAQVTGSLELAIEATALPAAAGRGAVAVAFPLATLAPLAEIAVGRDEEGLATDAVVGLAWHPVEPVELSAAAAGRATARGLGGGGGGFLSVEWEVIAPARPAAPTEARRRPGGAS